MAWATSDRLSRLPPWWSKFTDEYLKTHTRCEIKGEGCQVVATEVDHKIPGDDHSEMNLQPACERCHAKKSAREGNAAKARLKALRRRPRDRHPGEL
jgi:5-methylcytosine-specific restriction protein A